MPDGKCGDCGEAKELNHSGLCDECYLWHVGTPKSSAPKGQPEFTGSLTSLAGVKTALKDFINSRELEDGEVCNECIDVVNRWVDAFLITPSFSKRTPVFTCQPRKKVQLKQPLAVKLTHWLCDLR